MTTLAMDVRDKLSQIWTKSGQREMAIVAHVLTLTVSIVCERFALTNAQNMMPEEVIQLQQRKHSYVPQHSPDRGLYTRAKCRDVVYIMS